MLLLKSLFVILLAIKDGLDDLYFEFRANEFCSIIDSVKEAKTFKKIRRKILNATKEEVILIKKNRRRLPKINHSFQVSGTRKT